MHSPSIRGLNYMLEVCKYFAGGNCIVFSSKMTICIEFGRHLLNREKVIFNNQQLKWMDFVKHMGNYLDTTNNDTMIAATKKNIYCLC